MGFDASAYLVYGAFVPHDKLKTIKLMDNMYGEKAYIGVYNAKVYNSIYKIDCYHNYKHTDHMIILKEVQIQVVRAGTETPIEVIDPTPDEIQLFKDWLVTNYPDLQYGKYLVIDSDY
jgi:hypothetical protein